MQNNNDSTLRKRIIAEMTVDYSNSLEKNFDLAKHFVRITQEGKIDVLLKERLDGKENILLYLIGKLYAKEAELTEGDYVGNSEFLDELSIPSGSLLPWLKNLRDKGIIRQTKKGKYAFHSININRVEKILKNLDKKVRPDEKTNGE